MEYSKSVKNRLQRVNGQLQGILRMIEEERDCVEVVTQLSAIKSALDRTVGLVVSENLERCVRESVQSGESTDEHVQQAVKLLMKSR
ncbi:metal-sensitive transcriptional regulator [Paenisporosarcina cavernae]|uniref:Metal-sensitive transcriptional regulator n=1 Tax=Paenisporosarcina cavernae TaxID=2320858 RepID=A0A385YSL7_9BACL|nr:metal-sensitive transcriptional regulator [Paenisporosarcina cavernae]AYC28987.1 metal-sensitive transcriptional regulator [Paenisporosarcina cavernae]